MHAVIEYLRAIPAVHTATRLLFLCAGMLFAVWASWIPFMKTALDRNEAQLGVLLLCLGAGSLCVMPLTGLFVAAWGCRRVLWVAFPGAVTMLVLLLVTRNATVAAGVIALLGAFLGTADVAINIQAVAVEKQAQRALLSGFHALYSGGSMLGAGAMSALLYWGVPPMTGSLCVLAAVAVLAVSAIVHSLSEPAGREKDRDAAPRRRTVSSYVLFVGVLCFILFLAEGSVLDWSAVYLRDVAHAPSSQASLGFALFAAAVTVMRLLGDRLIHRVGRVRTVVVGGLIGALALLVLVFEPGLPVTLVAYALLGAGVANLIPIFFWAAGNQQCVPVEKALSAVSTLGYTGVLVGPALIGFVAHATSLPTAYGVVAGLVFAAALSGFAFGPSASVRH